MRTMFRADLDRLITDLARMARRAGQMVTNASNALHQNDITFAGLVIAERERMNSIHNDTERRCMTLLALQSPVAGDLRVVIEALPAAGHVKWMGSRACQTAVMARLKHPNP
jgi:phosphate transport system protein